MKRPILFLGLSIALLACSKSNDSTPPRVQAPSEAMGNGKVNAWSEMDAAGVPQAIGFTFSKGALDNLPNNAATNGSTAFMLSVPDEVSQKTPFLHLMINWNALGHEPVGIYDVPHFDMHFYMQPMAETMAIPPYPQAKAKFDSNPPDGFIPAGFAKNPGGVPGMGAHWGDSSSPEFKGQKFTDTFVYGSYDGKVTFWEEMTTLAFIKANPNTDLPIPQPAKYEKTGLYYPTRYGIKSLADGSHEVSFSQFVKR